MTQPLAALFGVLAAFAATPLLAAVARRRGWLDRAEGAVAGRKLQVRPVPPVGGLAVLLGLALTTAMLHLSGGHWDPKIAAWIDPRAGGAALVLAFLAGAVDDLVRGGVRPRAKVLLQSLAALPLSVSLYLYRLAESPDEPGRAALFALLLLCGAVLAQNLFNTFDNADGATASLGILALAFNAPVFAGPLLGFLPWNLNARRREGARGTPTAYLGDAGSHLLGLLILLVPAAWPALALPLFDLLRLCVRRLRVGSRPWIGDRRHLAHRLAHAGLRPLGVCLMLLVVALPGVARPDALGLFLTALFFAVAVALTREPEPLRD